MTPISASFTIFIYIQVWLDKNITNELMLTVNAVPKASAPFIRIWFHDKSSACKWRFFADHEKQMT